MANLDKKSLRKAYLERRKKLGEHFVLDASNQICDQLLESFGWTDQVTHVFLPMKKFNEPDIWPFIKALWKKEDIKVCTSITDIERNELHHYELTSSTRLKKNGWGTDEPVDAREVEVTSIDRVLIPLLAYDAKGNRIGYGKGFYDRFLSSCKVGTEKIGLSFFPAEDHIEDIHEADIPLDFCVTPTKTYRFTK
jgi:5-formyltetrahydrofolate cyclo-ligase